MRGRTLCVNGSVESAEQLLSTLIADALHRRDNLLLYKAYKESGYLEYDMGRPASARHEWTKALDIGETIANLPEFASVPLHAEMANASGAKKSKRPRSPI